MAFIRADRIVDILEYTEVAGGPPAPTGDPFDPYVKWWTRRRAGAPCSAERLAGMLRDFLFGDRSGEFWRLYLDRGLLVEDGRPDSDITSRWMVRQEEQGLCWLVDYNPRVYDPPLEHVELYALRLSPTPVNMD
ncbi:MAG TPA: hypothetical protein VGN26_04795 [Armatimonadota bacterium]|jgi:hypothetical protein